MALSGQFSNYPRKNFGLYCTWTAAQSVTGNYSNITLSVYLKYYNSLTANACSDAVISINGVTEKYTVPAIADTTSGVHTKLLKTKTVRVAHEINGTKSNVQLSASWTYAGPYADTSIGTITASTAVTLDSIDRSTPLVAFSVSNITASGFSISAAASLQCDIWQYSTNDGGSWTTFSTIEGTSAGGTISSLSPETTYTVKVRARRTLNHVYGGSSSTTVKTPGGAIVNSVSAVTADAATVSISINVTSYRSDFTHTLTIMNGRTAYLTISGLSWSVGTSTRTVTLTSAQRTTLLNAMKSIKSFTGTFTVTTYNGSTQIGSVSSKTAAVQTTIGNSGPAISGFTYADINTTTAGVTGNNQYFIQGYSVMQVTPGTVTAKNGASITNYTAACNGVSVSNTTGSALTVGTISKSGSVTITLTVTDSRGYTASYSKTVTVIAYSPPKVTSLTLRRTNDIEAEMQLIFNGSISAVSVNGTTKNALQYVRYRYKLTSSSSYGSYYSILSSVAKNGTSFSYSNLQLTNLNANSSYDFHLQIQDKLGSSTALDLYYVVPQGTPLIALRKKMVGINNPNPAAALDVVGEIHMNGFNVMGLMQAAIADDTDLNDLITPGIYFRRSTPSMSLNYPCTNFGMLEVFSCSANVVIQRYTMRDNPYTTYTRSRVNGDWQAWVKKS